MKSVYLLALIYGALFVSGCAGRLSTNSADGSLQDTDDNTYAVRLMPDGRQWLVQNLNINMPGSYCYNDSAQNCLKYGRLYTWESAKKGCEMLGKGWRLPTNDEWEQMAQHYGWIRTDTNALVVLSSKRS